MHSSSYTDSPTIEESNTNSNTVAVSITTVSQKKYEPRETPYGADTGLYATRDIKNREIVIDKEKPVVDYSRLKNDIFRIKKPVSEDPATSPLYAEERSAFFDQFGDVCSKLLDLSDGLLSRFRERRTAKHPYSVALSNGFDSGIYMEIARVNHSCCPNCEIMHDINCQSLIAAKSVKNDDELSITYVNPYDTFESRFLKLERLYNFRCNCQSCRRCKVDNAFREKSDRHRQRLKLLAEEILQLDLIIQDLDADSNSLFNFKYEYRPHATADLFLKPMCNCTNGSLLSGQEGLDYLFKPVEVPHSVLVEGAKEFLTLLDAEEIGSVRHRGKCEWIIDNLNEFSL